MLRKSLITAGVGALVAMAIGGASFASASNSGGGRTIVVIEKQTGGKFVDLGKKGPSAGDEFFFSSQFWNTSQTYRIGNNHGLCMFQSGNVLHCSGTAKLQGGTLEYAFQGDGSNNPPTPAVVGGTGGFIGANGQVNIHNLNSQGTLSRDVIVLTS